MKILVTGGAGFIGSALVRFLLAETDHIILNVDKLTYAGNTESVPATGFDQRYSLVRSDIADAAAMAGVIGRFQPDAIMHLAAESHVDRSILAPDAFIQSNIVGTYVLLTAALDHWRTLKGAARDSFRFLHISTDEVFGSLGQEGLFSEGSLYDPSSPYSASKAASDHLVRAWHRTYGLPTIITNCSNNYGPYQFPEKLIPLVVIKALINESVPVYGDGHQVRDWLYVDDHVRALYHVLQHGAVGETYAVGGHNEQANLAVVQTICDIIDRHLGAPGGRVSRRDLIRFVDDRPGHDRRYAIDASKIQRELGWTPRESFASGLEKTVLWYLENREWWTRVMDGSYISGRSDYGQADNE